MLEDWAGVAVIVSVQIVTFFLIKRRLDRLDEAISRLEKAVAETRSELTRQIAELTEQIAAMHTGLTEQIATMTEPSPSYSAGGVASAPSDDTSNTPGRSTACHSDANGHQR